MNTRLQVVVMSLVFVSMVTAIAGCGPSEPVGVTDTPEVEGSPVAEVTEVPLPTQALEQEPIVLRVGIIAEPDCLNPFTCSYHYFFVDYIYEGYKGWGPECELIPRLAESMEVSEDGLTWTLQLRKGVTYSDGEPFNAYTVKEFWDWFTSLSLREWYVETLLTESSEALDEYTFQFTTSEPTGVYSTYNGVWHWPLPPNVWGQLDEETIWTFENDNPVGTGPYTLTEWVPGQYLIYDARDDYWGGKPPVDRIVMQVYSNWDSIVQALLAGEIDVSDGSMPAQYYDVLSADPNVTVVEQPPGFHYYLAFNMADGGLRHPAIEDPAVRKAIDYAIDRQQVIDVALLGHGIQCPTDWACGPLYEVPRNPNLVVTPFDLSEANQILDESGYLDADGDGVRETADGQPLDLRFYYDVEDPTMDVIARLMSGWLSQIGIQAQVEALEGATLTDTMLDLRDYDMALRRWIDENDPAGMDFYFTCWSADLGSGMLNDSGYCNPEFDDMVYALYGNVGWENREPYAFEASRILNQDRPVITVVGENFLQAYRDDHFTYQQNGCPGMAGLWDWYSVMHVEPIK